MAWVKGCNRPSDTFRESPGQGVATRPMGPLECRTLGYCRPVTRDYIFVSEVGVEVPCPRGEDDESPGQARSLSRRGFALHVLC